MYSINQVLILIDYNEKKLATLRQNGASQSEIDQLEEELKSLKLYESRYKIAEILGLENEPKYSNINYIGIEKEDLSRYNLTQDQINEITTLINTIPVDDVDLFRARLELAKLLKLDNDEDLRQVNFEGIENNDPNNIVFQLTSQDIATFNNIKSTVETIKQNNNTTNMNFNSITERTMEEIFNILDNFDETEYQSRKDEYLENYYKLIDLTKTKKFTNVNNYSFADDLFSKYPNSTIELTSNCISDLIILLNNSNLEEETYNRYIKLITNNINRLSQDDNNLNDINNLLRLVDNTNYSLRIDLNNNINVDTIAIKNTEISNLLSYLDSEYNNLEEQEKNKLYTELNKLIKNEINNLNKVNQINSILNTINNKELKERIRNDFVNEYKIKFSDRHVSSYNGLVSDQIKALEAKKNKYLNKKTGIETLDVIYKTKAKEIEKEIERLKNLNLEYDNFILNSLNSVYNNKSDKILKIEKDIKKLQELKSNLTSSFQIKRVEKRIEKLNNKIKKLKSKQGKIIGHQKSIMAPKLWVKAKRGMIKAHFESKAEIFEQYANDYRQMAETTRNLNGMFSGIKAMFYDFKSNMYNSRSEFNRAIFDTLNNPNNRIQVNGNNRRRMNRNVVNQMRNNMQPQAQRAI